MAGSRLARLARLSLKLRVLKSDGWLQRLGFKTAVFVRVDESFHTSSLDEVGRIVDECCQNNVTLDHSSVFTIVVCVFRGLLGCSKLQWSMPLHQITCASAELSVWLQSTLPSSGFKPILSQSSVVVKACHQQRPSLWLGLGL